MYVTSKRATNWKGGSSINPYPFLVKVSFEPERYLKNWCSFLIAVLVINDFFYRFDYVPHKKKSFPLTIGLNLELISSKNHLHVYITRKPVSRSWICLKNLQKIQLCIDFAGNSNCSKIFHFIVEVENEVVHRILDFCPR